MLHMHALCRGLALAATLVTCSRRTTPDGASGDDRKRRRSASPTATAAVGAQGNWCASLMPKSSTLVSTGFPLAPMPLAAWSCSCFTVDTICKRNSHREMPAPAHASRWTPFAGATALIRETSQLQGGMVHTDMGHACAPQQTLSTSVTALVRKSLQLQGDMRHAQIFARSA